MIKILESKSSKVPGDTSLFISSAYNEKVLEIMRRCDTSYWDNKTKLWEIPCNQLSYVIDELTYIDDISLNLLPDKKEDQLEISQIFKTEMFDYQKEGVNWLLNHKNALLLDPPGLGKTLQITYLAEELHARGECEHCLILCGINSLKLNWEKEIKKHSRLDCVVIGKKVNSKGKVGYTSVKDRADQLYNKIDEFFVILNIESLRDNLVVDAIRNSKNKFDLIAFDEVHKANSPTSQQGKNLLKLKTVGKRHIGMTGTLLTNNPLNAYVPLKFIGKENSTFTSFKNYYCVFTKEFGHNSLVGYKNLDVLQNEINECSIRRSKNLLNLPPKTIVPEFIEMDPKHQKFYEDISKGVIEEADRVDIKSTSLLGLIVRLRQASSCPELLTSTEMSNCKIDRACELVDEIIQSGEKVVIFSAFKEPLRLLEERLRKYNPLVGTGDIDDKVVSDNIDKFQTDPNYKVFLGTTQKMGTGITLTAASYEIHIDTAWTYADFEQTCDRCWRIGSTKPVIIYNLIANGTIDERVWSIINRKKGISDYLVDGNASQDEDLRYLLGLNSLSAF